MIQDLAVSKGNQFSHARNTPGGAGFFSHAQDTNAIEKVETENYDYLILQEQSVQLANERLGFAKYSHGSFIYADFLDHTSKVADRCHKTLLYLTWGRKEGLGFYTVGGPYGDNYQEMQNQLTDNYLRLAESLNAEVAPAGEAWRKVIEDYPQIDLYSGDGSHPSLAGTYLTACVFYTALFHENVSGAAIPVGVPTATGQILQTVADQLVVGSWSDWYIDTAAQPCTSGGLKSNNAQWTNISPLPDGRYYEIEFTENQHGFVKLNGPGAWQTWDAGDNWTEVPLPTFEGVFQYDADIFDITFANQDTAWLVVGDDEIDSTTLAWDWILGSTADFESFVHILRSTNGGNSWEEMGPPRIDYQISDSGSLMNRPQFFKFYLQFDSGKKGTIIGSYGDDNDSTTYTFRTDNAGLNWEVIATPIESSTPEVWFQDATVAYKGGRKNETHLNGDPLKIFKTENRGTSWEEVASFDNNCCELPDGSIDHGISTIKMVRPDTLLAINNLYNPTVYRSTDGGTSWDSISTIPEIGKVMDIVQPAKDTYYAVMQGKVNRIVASYDAGLTWELEAHLPTYLTDITVANGYIYATGSFDGQIYRKPIAWLTAVGDIQPQRPDFELFPNPTSESVDLQGTPPNTPIFIYNNLGALVHQSKANASGRAHLALGDLPGGIYFVRVQTAAKKLVIK